MMAPIWFGNPHRPETIVKANSVGAVRDVDMNGILDGRTAAEK